MIKSFVLAVVTAFGALAATSAHAGVHWSIGINVPVVGAVVSGGPAYGPGYYEPGYAEPDYAAPVYYDPGYARAYAPPPVYVPAPRARYYPPQVIYRPVPVAYPRYYTNEPPRWRHDNGRARWEERYRDERDDRWDGHGRR